MDLPAQIEKLPNAQEQAQIAEQKALNEKFESVLKNAQLKLMNSKLNGEWKEVSYTIDGQEKTHTVYSFPDGYINNLKKELGAGSLRILTPGGIMTMDYRIDRINIEVDKNFLVINVTRG